MLNVVFHRDSSNRLSSVIADGHAESGPHGEDIVCAAVSAILQAARMGLESHVKIDLAVEQEPGSLSMVWPEAARDDVAVIAIVATAELSVMQIARQYPEHVNASVERDA